MIKEKCQTKEIENKVKFLSCSTKVVCDHCVTELHDGNKCFCEKCFYTVPDKRKLLEIHRALKSLFEKLSGLTELINSL